MTNLDSILKSRDTALPAKVHIVKVMIFHCSHEIKRCLLLGRKAVTDLDSVLKSRDITLPISLYSKRYGFFSSHVWISPVAQPVKYLSTMWETWVPSVGQEDSMEKEMANHSSTLA